MPEPMYRFLGRVAPSARVRTPILAAAPEAAVEGGVATLRLYEPIDSWGGPWGISAKEFVETLDRVDADEIRLHINSPGGEVWEATAILNALRRHPARVVSVVDGIAASAASVIAVGADEMVMARNSELMMHDAWGIGIGPAADMRDLADRLDKVSDNIASVYASKAGGSVADWRALMLAETWFSAEEAVTARLADRLEGDEQDTDAKNAFDLSIFKHAGRAQAPAPVLPRDEPEPAEPAVDDRAIRHRYRQRAAARR